MPRSVKQVVVIDDDKFHIDSKLFRDSPVQWVTLGATKRRGAVTHGINDSILGFLMGIKINLKGETAAGCAMLLLQHLCGAASIETLDLSNKLILQDRGYTCKDVASAIQNAGGSFLGTFRTGSFSPYSIDTKRSGKQTIVSQVREACVCSVCVCVCVW